MTTQSHGAGPYAVSNSVTTTTVLLPAQGARDLIGSTITQQMLGIFGTGVTEIVLANKTFTVPAGVTKLRLTAIGGGGGGSRLGEAGGNGGTTSFATHCIADGGQGGQATQDTTRGGLGGIAQVGDLLFNGGNGGRSKTNSVSGAGGGGVGTPLGEGGIGSAATASYEGSMPFELGTQFSVPGLYSSGGASGGGFPATLDPILLAASPAASPRFYFDALIGDHLSALRRPGQYAGRPGPLPLWGGDGAGGDTTQSGGGGGGGGYLAGGCSGYGLYDIGTVCWGGEGGLGGGGGGGRGAGAANHGRGGGGGACAIKVLTVTPGQTFAISVGAGGVPAVGGGQGGAGCLIVEW